MFQNSPREIQCLVDVANRVHGLRSQLSNPGSCLLCTLSPHALSLLLLHRFSTKVKDVCVLYRRLLCVKCNLINGFVSNVICENIQMST